MSYADDLKAVTDHLNLSDAIHVGHSTGGGEVVRYLARHGDKNVAKAAIISAGALIEQNVAILVSIWRQEVLFPYGSIADEPTSS